MEVGDGDVLVRCLRPSDGTVTRTVVVEFVFIDSRGVGLFVDPMRSLRRPNLRRDLFLLVGRGPLPSRRQRTSSLEFVVFSGIVSQLLRPIPYPR